ncbi:MAG: hypothetical protein ABI741_09675 [Ferruginibacter sp.]
MKRSPLFIFIIALIIGLCSCKKSNEDFQTVALNDYYPLVAGKYIVYDLDSLIYITSAQPL